MPVIRLSSEAEDDFAFLQKSEKKKVIKNIKTLEENELIGKPLTGKLKGLYSLRAWPYRIIYQISSKGVFTIHKILHRKIVYKSL